jgi:transcriptional regulator with XRE-family HTH domain
MLAARLRRVRLSTTIWSGGAAAGLYLGTGLILAFLVHTHYPGALASVGTIFAHSFSERSAMAVRLQFAAKDGREPHRSACRQALRMRRKMLAMSQQKLGAALGLTFQQVQKYEIGATRIAASRLQQMSHILQVPLEFFFEGAPNASAPHGSNKSELWMAQIDDFVSDSDGLRLIGAFMRIDNAALRRRIVMLVQEIAGDDD